MVVCPSCKEQVPHSASECPRCGEKIIPGDKLENISTPTTPWQIFVIIVSIIILIAIGFTFYGAENRENKAAQINFTQPVKNIIGSVGTQTGLGNYYGMPTYKLDAETKQAKLTIVFPTGPLTQQQAAAFAQAVCGELAREYVRLGYMPRHIEVLIGTALPQNRVYYYGAAIYNGNIDALGWESAK